MRYGPTLVEGPISYTSGESGATIRRFSGTQAEIENLAVTLTSQGYVANVDEGQEWSLVATLNYNSQQDEQTEPAAKWSVVSTPSEQNILESDIDLVKYLSAQTKESILLALKNPGKGYPLYSTTASERERIAAYLMYNYMLIGADSRRINLKSVTRTIIVSDKYVNKWTLQDENKVLSKSYLISKTGMPLWVQTQIPETQMNFLRNSTTTPPAPPPDIYVNKAYLETGLQSDNVPNNQVQISQTWIYNDWLFDYYPIAG
jgi:hypothetical protein